MGQQPNIEINEEERPRQELEPAAAPRWRPDRPGEIGGPQDTPRGGAFGRPGPDAGFALTLLKRAKYEPISPRQILTKGIVAVATARAALLSRGPTMGDIEVALTLTGHRDAGLSKSSVAALADRTRSWLEHASYELPIGSGLVDMIPVAQLRVEQAQLLRLIGQDNP